MARIPTHRSPTRPGEMLLKEFLIPMGLTQRELAEGIQVPYQRVNEIVRGRRGITPSTALRLAKFFGNHDLKSAGAGRQRHSPRARTYAASTVFERSGTDLPAVFAHHEP